MDWYPYSTDVPPATSQPLEATVPVSWADPADARVSPTEDEPQYIVTVRVAPLPETAPASDVTMSQLLPFAPLYGLLGRLAKLCANPLVKLARTAFDPNPTVATMARGYPMPHGTLSTLAD